MSTEKRLGKLERFIQLVFKTEYSEFTKMENYMKALPKDSDSDTDETPSKVPEAQAKIMESIEETKDLLEDSYLREDEIIFAIRGAVKDIFVDCYKQKKDPTLIFNIMLDEIKDEVMKEVGDHLGKIIQKQIPQKPTGTSDQKVIDEMKKKQELTKAVIAEIDKTQKKTKSEKREASPEPKKKKKSKEKEKDKSKKKSDSDSDDVRGMPKKKNKSKK